ncbi:MAG: hypothetical protein C0179_01570 [Fervidicoccus sp.]|nr:MAG: hypothetical protein C0179_01570 [Fervidicoccus sp.]
MEVYVFMRWNIMFVGEDVVKELVKRLTSEFDISVVENAKGDYIIKGDGVVGYLHRKGYISTRLKENTVRWLVEKCKEDKNIDHVIGDITFEVYGKYVRCDELQKFLKEGSEYSGTLSVIVNANSNDARLIEVISEYLGGPDLIRPY